MHNKWDDTLDSVTREGGGLEGPMQRKDELERENLSLRLNTRAHPPTLHVLIQYTYSVSVMGNEL